MLKKLKKTFILIAMFTMIIIISIFFIAITYSNYKRALEKADILTTIICNNSGHIPEYQNDGYSNKEKKIITPESEFSTRYAVINLDENNESHHVDLSHIASMTESQAVEYAKQIAQNKKDTGFYENYRYRIQNTENGKMIILLDYNVEINYLKDTTSRGIIIIIIGLIFIFVLISVFSNKALKPVEENIERQKQFVTNAGHDLKTPIAVILANTEILEMTLGENNEWVNSIKRQAIRLDKLTKGLLTMSKIDENNNIPEKTEFSLTDLVEQELKDLKTLAQEKNIKINYRKNDVNMCADKNLIRQVIVILIDNAIKYTDDNGNIDICVTQNKKQAQFEIINDYKNYKEFKPEKVFDRFYREDKSRNSEKNIGYGIGLSMAKSIVSAHKGKIKADITKDNRVKFTVII